MSWAEGAYRNERAHAVADLFFTKGADVLESMLQENTVDFERQQQVAKALTEIMEDFVDSSVQHIDCRIDLYKVTFKHASKAELDRFQENAVATAAFWMNSGRMGRQTALSDGTYKYELCFTKDDGGKTFYEMKERLYEMALAVSTSGRIKLN